MNDTELSTPSERETGYLLTPTRKDAPDGYLPPYQPVPEAFDHEHRLDYYLTDDEHEVVYCTLCGTEW